MSEPISHLVIAASHRPDSFNRKLAMLATEYLKSTGDKVDFQEYEYYDLPIYNDQMRIDGEIPAKLAKIKEQLTNIDSLIISTPEYNWSYPASLKNLIDWLSIFRPYPFEGKTAFLMSAYLSTHGGNGVSHFKTPLEGLGAHVFSQSFLVNEADKSLIDDKLKPHECAIQFTNMITNYRTYAKSLKN